MIISRDIRSIPTAHHAHLLRIQSTNPAIISTAGCTRHPHDSFRVWIRGARSSRARPDRRGLAGPGKLRGGGSTFWPAAGIGCRSSRESSHRQNGQWAPAGFTALTAGAVTLDPTRHTENESEGARKGRQVRSGRAGRETLLPDDKGRGRGEERGGEEDGRGGEERGGETGRGEERRGGG